MVFQNAGVGEVLCSMAISLSRSTKHAQAALSLHYIFQYPVPHCCEEVRKEIRPTQTDKLQATVKLVHGGDQTGH